MGWVEETNAIVYSLCSRFGFRAATDAFRTILSTCTMVLSTTFGWNVSSHFVLLVSYYYNCGIGVLFYCLLYTVSLWWHIEQMQRRCHAACAYWCLLSSHHICGECAVDAVYLFVCVLWVCEHLHSGFQPRHANPPLRTLICHRESLISGYANIITPNTCKSVISRTMLWHHTHTHTHSEDKPNIYCFDERCRQKFYKRIV